MAKKKKKQPATSRTLKVPPIAVIDNIILSQKEVWAYYKLAERPYLYLSNSMRESIANSTITALGSICQSSVRRVDCHLLINNEPFDPDPWADDIIAKYKEKNKTVSPIFERFITEQADELYHSNYNKRVTYLGIKLGNRGAFDFSSVSPLEFGFKDAFSMLKRGISELFQFNEYEITAEEESKHRKAEGEIFTTLANSDLEARRITSEEALLLIKRRFYPAMPVPYLETDYDNRIGLSDIVIETGGVVEENARYVKISQMWGEEEVTGYRATLSFSAFPKRMVFPNPFSEFLHMRDILAFTVNCRFSMIPTEAMKKELASKKLETKDEIKNLQQGNIDVPTHLIETVKSQQILEADLENSNLPWIIGHYRITVESHDLDNLKELIAGLKNEYKKYDYVLNWTTGDQLDLMKEEFVGGELLMKSFGHTTNLVMLGVAGINLGSTVGDPVVQIKRFTDKR